MLNKNTIKLIKEAVENEIDNLEDEVNYALREIIDSLKLKELNNPKKILEALVLARKIFFNE